MTSLGHPAYGGFHNFRVPLYIPKYTIVLMRRRPPEGTHHQMLSGSLTQLGCVGREAIRKRTLQGHAAETEVKILHDLSSLRDHPSQDIRYMSHNLNSFKGVI